MIIIGITGTLGAGKGTVVDYLVKKHGFKHFSVSGFLKEEIIKRDVEVDRTALVNLGNELRKKYGSDYIVKTLLHKAIKEKRNCVIESLRNTKEIEVLKKFGNFYLFSIDADPKLRYKRIQKRGGEKDKVTYRQFLENEKSTNTR